MKTMILIIKWLLAVVFFSIGPICILWGVFCLFGGPDPGAGSGHDGPKFCAIFTTIGIATILAGLGILTFGREKKR